MGQDKNYDPSAACLAGYWSALMHSEVPETATQGVYGSANVGVLSDVLSIHSTSL